MKRLVAAVSLLAWLSAAWPAAGADKPVVVELWPGKVPDETGKVGPETVRMSPKLTRKEVEVTEPTRLVTNVSKPTITAYRPVSSRTVRAASAALPKRVGCPDRPWVLFWVAVRMGSRGP